MAVLKMCKINICAMRKNRKKILEYLQRKGCLEIQVTDNKDSVFEKVNTATQISIFERNIATAENALEILNTYCPEEKSMFSGLEGKKQVSQKEIDEVIINREQILKTVKNILQAGKEIEEKQADSIRFGEEIKSLEPWKDMDVPMNLTGTSKTGFMIGSISGSYNQEEVTALFEKIEELPKATYAQVVSSDKYQTYITVVYIKEKQDQVEKALRSLSFNRPPLITSHTPRYSIQKRDYAMNAIVNEIAEIQKQLEEYSKERHQIEKMTDYYRVRAEKYKVVSEILQTKHTFFVSGYIPQRDLQDIKDTLEKKYTVQIDVEEPKENEDVPVILSNNKTAAAVEGVVTSFGFPAKHEIDPTSITAFFYYFFFGIMLSDAAYGALMFLGCLWALKKFPNMSKEMQKTLRMFKNCGISTLVWGILFGGYFGDAVTVIGKTFFGADITIPPLWFAPIEKPMTMLIYCMIFGIVHLFVGLGIKGYMMLRQKDVTSFICDVLLWYVFLIGLILMLIPTSIFASLAGATIVFPNWANTLAKALALIGVLGILLMAGRRAKNPVKRLLLGAYSLYDTTSWLSDLLSYSRLLALGLATGVIAQVINTMAAMGGRSVIGVIMFIVVFFIGHTFNMAINLLGAYVHTNRLQYVEFFGKFYEGGSREFKPFKENTKYVDVKES